MYLFNSIYVHLDHSKCRFNMLQLTAPHESHLPEPFLQVRSKVHLVFAALTLQNHLLCCCAKKRNNQDQRGGLLAHEWRHVVLVVLQRFDPPLLGIISNATDMNLHWSKDLQSIEYFYSYTVTYFSTIVFQSRFQSFLQDSKPSTPGV